MKSLPFRLLLGVVIGILVGLVANEGFMNIVVTADQFLCSTYCDRIYSTVHYKAGQ